MYVKNNIDEYAKLYEENIGLINEIVGEWLIELSEGGKYEKPKYQRELKKEDSNLYRKPTEEELRELRAFIEEEV